MKKLILLVMISTVYFCNVGFAASSSKQAHDALDGLGRQGKGEAGNKHANEQIKEAFPEPKPKPEKPEKMERHRPEKPSRNK